jgi:hypothetical protein
MACRIAILYKGVRRSSFILEARMLGILDLCQYNQIKSYSPSLMNVKSE